ncbi:MAG: phosphate/phosphite/phosphonate ABC transporter substrate-binding protein [Candidatus Omnitrophota bacterium]|nr:phosphate/phosphite/phosphonate ABC transporter substrate-binding protein [Candidatus Omnitrophota bacterium]
MNISYKRTFLTCLVALAAGIFCMRAAASAAEKNIPNGKILRIGVVPEQNILEQKAKYGAVSRYLSKKLGMDVHISILEKYEDIYGAFSKKEIDAGFFGSFSYVKAHDALGVEVIARPVWKDGIASYTGYIFVRKDSSILSVPDMKGKRLALVSKETTAGYVFPVTYFKENGIEDIQKYFSKVYFAGSHDISAWSVYIGETDIGACKSRVFNALAAENPDFADKMVILSESLKFPSNSIAVSGEMDGETRTRIKDVLIGMNTEEEGRQALEGFGAIGFIATTDEDFAPLYDMIRISGISK